MKFNIMTSEDNFSEDYQKLLAELGFKLKKYKLPGDEDSRSAITNQGVPEIEINTLEELLEFTRKYGHNYINIENNCIILMEDVVFE